MTAAGIILIIVYAALAGFMVDEWIADKRMNSKD